MAPDITFKTEPNSTIPDSTSYEEPYSFDIVNSLYLSRCAFFGESFFNDALTECLFRDNVNSDRDGDWLRRQLQEEMIEFPYPEFISQVDTLHNTNVPGENSANSNQKRHVAMTKTGVVLHGGNSEIRRKLLSLVQTRGRTIPINVQTESILPSSSDPAHDSDESERLGISSYTMLINEWATRSNRNITFTPRQLSIDPPRWQMVLAVGDDSFVGNSHKLKHAKHLASKQAVEELKLDTEHARSA